MEETPGVIEKYKHIVGDFAHKSEFVRKHMESENGMLYFKPKSVPTIIDLLKLAKQNNYKIVIAHPAYMIEGIDYVEYIDALIELTHKSDEYQKFWGIEGPYMLNSSKETQHIIKIANEKNMVYTSGSDSRYSFKNEHELNKMYYIDPITKEKIYYTPQPGLAIRTKMEGVEDYLKMPSSVLDQLNDLRVYYKKN